MDHSLLSSSRRRMNAAPALYVQDFTGDKAGGFQEHHGINNVLHLARSPKEMRPARLALQRRVPINVDPVRRLRRLMTGFAILSVVERRCHASSREGERTGGD